MLKKRAELNAIQLQQAASNFWYVVKTCLKNRLDLLFFFFLSEGHPTGMMYVVPSWASKFIFANVFMLDMHYRKKLLTLLRPRIGGLDRNVMRCVAGFGIIMFNVGSARSDCQ